MNPNPLPLDAPSDPCPHIIINELDNPSLASIPQPSRNTPNPCIRLFKTIKQGFWLLNKHILSIYFLFNTLLLLALISKTLVYPKVVYYWIGSSCFLLLSKTMEFLNNNRGNRMRSFELLQRLEGQIRMARAVNVVRRATRQNPFMETLFRNDQNLVHILTYNENNALVRFPEYNTVFSNILRLRVHVLAMRMNLMLHALGVASEEEDPGAANNGMEQSEIDDLEAKLYHINEKSEEKECTICLETLHEGEEIRDLACAHTFHRICIDKWLLLQRLCPYCRTVV